MVGAAFEVFCPAVEPLGKVAILPPLKDNLEDELARDPGRKGEGIFGECAMVPLREGEGGGGPFIRGGGDGDRVLAGSGGVAGIVSNGAGVAVFGASPACASSFDSEEGPADAEFDRLRIVGNKCEFGDLVGPSSDVEVPDCEVTSPRGGLMGRSRGGELEITSWFCRLEDFRRLAASVPGFVQSSTSSM